MACRVSPLSLSNTHTSSHQCLLSENEYCFCLCEHLTFDYDYTNNVVLSDHLAFSPSSCVQIVVAMQMEWYNFV